MAVRCAGFRRAGIDETKPSATHDRSDRVALLHGQPADRAGEAAGEFDFRNAGGTEIHRAAGIEHEAAAQIGVGLELFDVKAVGAAVGAPIEPAQIVAGDVFAILGEFDAGAAVWAGMPAGDGAHHRAARGKRNGRQPRENLRFDETAWTGG